MSIQTKTEGNLLLARENRVAEEAGPDRSSGGERATENNGLC